jgi:hypothetical protein
MDPALPPEPEPEPPEDEWVDVTPTNARQRMPRLELHLIVDPEAGEAEIRIDGDADPIRMSFREGRWQQAD